MEGLTFDYFYGLESEQFTFYRIPKVLFTDPRFKGVSAEAKTLYGILLDRMSLSAKNGWLDADGRVFIIFSIEEVSEALGCGSQKAVKLLSELEQKCGLIERKRQGLGKPNLIYVKNFINPQKSQFLNGENHNSGMMKSTIQEFPKSPSNNTEIKKTDKSDTEIFPFLSEGGDYAESQDADGMGNDIAERQYYREIISENIAYEILLQDYPYDRDTIEEILELIVDTVCTKRKTIRIAGDDKSAEVVKSQFLKLTDEHIRYCMDCLKENTSDVRNIRQYLLATLYNSTLTLSAYYSAKVRHDMAQGYDCRSK